MVFYAFSTFCCRRIHECIPLHSHYATTHNDNLINFVSVLYCCWHCIVQFNSAVHFIHRISHCTMSNGCYNRRLSSSFESNECVVARLLADWPALQLAYLPSSVIIEGYRFSTYPHSLLFVFLLTRSESMREQLYSETSEPGPTQS